MSGYKQLNYCYKHNQNRCFFLFFFRCCCCCCSFPLSTSHRIGRFVAISKEKVKQFSALIVTHFTHFWLLLSVQQLISYLKTTRWFSFILESKGEEREKKNCGRAKQKWKHQNWTFIIHIWHAEYSDEKY